MTSVNTIFVRSIERIKNFYLDETTYFSTHNLV